MNELQNFNFEGNEVRTVLINDEPYFVGKDIADVLGYSNSRKALIDHVDEEDKNTVTIRDGNKGNPNQVVINESGMYSLVLSSKLPNAKKFKRWVTNEVLPSIRKHGAYMTDEKIEEALLNPDTIISLATKLKNEREKVEVERNGRLIAEQRVEELQPKADYYDQILSNKGVVTVTSIAKNYGMTAPELNKLLNQLGVQYSQSGSWYLYKKYQKNGYTHTIPVPYSHRDGRPDIKPQTKWTQKGHIFIYQLLKEHGILPMIEMKDASAM
ncbi:phage antirepressor [Pediococcus pentosaceus]|uniref:phage antirepressor n=1 Tax=Pediococcus pentosaceus TaxID=1255 RepID=UPI000E00F080|nr:phage antirepressor [Pediococcus pentosaceus]AXR43540.1 phage antirepressor protein [Pediococcus pentosaceus]KAF0520029.1 phage antirepressor protein [Pediococcus pentosaceus]MBF7110729.1 phage antirepressor [Pediococcus pentosaceus]MBF7117701.1 phage antirepressor [Pediococcus pentosaceus]MCS8577994.1 phage antirepressor protein [Pediococcus pentosaceus]